MSASARLQLRSDAFGELDGFARDYLGDDLAWVACATLHNLLTVRTLQVTSRPRSVSTHLRRVYHPVRMVSSFGELRGRCSLVEGALFSYVTVNHWRSLGPVIDAACRSGGRAEPVERTPPRLELRAALSEAGRRADDLISRLRRSRTPFVEERFVHYTFLLAARALVTARVLLEASAPDVVVVSSNHGADLRALARQARKNTVPTVYVPHAPLLTHERLCDMPFDYAALRGNREVNWYLERGAPPEQVSAVGNPSLTPPAEPVAPAAGAPTVLALSPDPTEIVREIVAATYLAAGDEVVLAPHPRQRMDELRAVVPATWRVSHGRTYDLLRTGPSAVIQYSSGVALEAMLLGIPCIELSLHELPPAYPFLATDLVPRVTASTHLAAAVATAIRSSSDPAHRAALVSWGRSWCSGSGEAAADAAWGFVQRCRDRGAALDLVWDAWSGLTRDTPSG